MDTDGKRGCADVLRVDMLACGCVACGWMLCVWMRISVKKKKKKEEKKDLLQVGCERVDALACGHELDADGCEEIEKEKEKKGKETLTGRRSWMWMVVDADGGTHGLVVAQLMTQHV